MENKENSFRTKKPFWQRLFRLVGDNEGTLVGTRCNRCGVNFFPGREFCSSCFQNDKIIQTDLSRFGILYTYTTVYRGKPNFKVPYSVGYVDLKEGVRIFAPLFDMTPGEIKVGMEMELVFRDMGWVSGQEEALVYGFRPIRK
jgi:uncharacterized OB-fold protein